MNAFTDEQAAAIERRHGRVLLDAGAGSGKTSVLVERYARAVLEDGVDPQAILAITFTEKAAAEMRERIRRRLSLADNPAWILTIHGFCARVLRTHALAAGLDPRFSVLEEDTAAELSEAAFTHALDTVASTPEGRDLIAAYGVGPLTDAVRTAHRALRSRGQRHPRLPVVLARPATTTATELAALARAVAGELGVIPDPGVTVRRALDQLARTDFETDWPLALADLPSGARALNSDACAAYRAAVAERRRALADALAPALRDGLNALLIAYDAAYERAKQERGVVDFDDLELLARERLEAGHDYRFAHVLVDELQDTNPVQLALVDLISPGAAVFMVGDAQQSIYGFRHADVSLFQERGREIAAEGGRLALRANFRTRAEILTVLNALFADQIDDYQPLRAGRRDPPAPGPCVELLVADKKAEWAEEDGLGAPWRVAEARALAARVAALVGTGEARAGDIALLARASTDLGVYERALEAAGVPTFLVGGRGYWGHPQVVVLVAYLRVLANAEDREAYWTVLLSGLCGLSLDGLVLLAAGDGDALELEDAGRLARFEAFFASQRTHARSAPAAGLIEAVLEWSGYDLAVAAMPGGTRRLANVRKLLALSRAWETTHGYDLGGLVAALARRAAGPGGGEPEAPLEAESVDAVALMTIHRSKGLEFPVVCVADLGRGPAHDAGLIRIGADGRLGLRVTRPGAGTRVEALDHAALREAALVADRAEQRRLFYVAMTRARERLILSGAVRAGAPGRPESMVPIDWIAPPLRGLAGVAVTDLSDPAALATSVPGMTAAGGPGVDASSPGAGVPGTPAPVAVPSVPPARPVPPAAPVRRSPAVTAVSYSGLSLYERCGHRFYTERILGMPPRSMPASGARARGIDLHARLAAGELDAITPNATVARLLAATGLRREQPFTFSSGGLLIRGVFDAIAAEPDRLLVVDYKTDALGDRTPEAIAADHYGLQRLIYALAALRTGAAEVEVVHLFTAAVHEPATRLYVAADRDALESDLSARLAGLAAGSFPVSSAPGPTVCAGCPAAAGLCPVL
ncbi:exodeoxyribonuclease V subunit beta [Conexibacter sp. DBS9H8]|uniref:UvrD-helicase domain-containing protein n=1 Tax=Conexibacter sp. DBS9H8 TaxID=2937801 RepID=UPI0020109DC5|nr:UvrD-helicase domain-containing protein [Conexibacter sp. DBS9H8]